MHDDALRRQLELEIENISLNQLNDLGNQAVRMGLIAGHGYHKGRYEIIRQGQVLTMSADHAFDYLQDLVESIAEDKGS